MAMLKIVLCLLFVPANCHYLLHFNSQLQHNYNLLISILKYFSIDSPTGPSSLPIEAPTGTISSQFIAPLQI